MKKIGQYLEKSWIVFTGFVVILLPQQTRAAGSTVEVFKTTCPATNFGSLKAMFNDKVFNGTSPEKGLGSITCAVYSIINMALSFATILAVIMILYGAFLYITSMGDDTKIETAKKTVLWAVISILVFALSFTIIYLIQGQVKVPTATP